MARCLTLLPSLNLNTIFLYFVPTLSQLLHRVLLSWISILCMILLPIGNTKEKYYVNFMPLVQKYNEVLGSCLSPNILPHKSLYIWFICSSVSLLIFRGNAASSLGWQL